MMILIWVIVGVGIYWLLKDNKKDNSDRSVNELKLSFARGNISEEEYLRRLSVLKGSGLNEKNY